jgi:hypothetical protein
MHLQFRTGPSSLCCGQIGPDGAHKLFKVVLDAINDCTKPINFATMGHTMVNADSLYQLLPTTCLISTATQLPKDQPSICFGTIYAGYERYRPSQVNGF